MDKILLLIKNGYLYKKKYVNIYPKTLKKTIFILNLLYNEGFILSYIYNKNKFKIYLNYTNFRPILTIYKNFYKKSSLIYLTYKDICLFKDSMSLLIISNQYGIMTHYEALKKYIGGQLLFFLK